MPNRLNRDFRTRRQRLAAVWVAVWGVSAASGVARPAAEASPAARLDQYLSKFESSYSNVRSLRAQFTQSYDWGGRRRVESGTVAFARGGKMRWEYQEPKKKLVVSDGKRLWVYIPEEMQVTRSSMKSSDDPRVPFPLLLSNFKLRKAFSKIEFADGASKAEPQDQLLRGLPRRGYEDEYREVLIELTPGFDIRRLAVFYPDDSVMEFTFGRIQKNLSLDPGTFKFAPPEGAEIIDQ